MDGVVELRRVEGNADGDQSIHLVVLLTDAIVLSIFLEILGSGDVNENVGEHADGIGITPQHHVAKADVVIRSKMRSHDAREHGFLIQLDIIQCFEREAKIAEQTVHTQQADD